MKPAQHIVRMIKERRPDFRHTEADIWDLLPAARGLTVVTVDGSVLPLPCGDGAAKQLLHAWSVQAEQDAQGK